MSSPAGLQHYQADFLARWLPSSTRAGVILSPGPDLAASLRHNSAIGSPSLEPDDSFASDFAPLPASADSSCLGVDGSARSPGEGKAGTDRVEDGLSSSVSPKNLDGELDSLDEMASKCQDVPLMMELEQLRKWQQHMQEQLKAHQLEELLHLQEEQQRLLGKMDGSQRCTEDDTESSEWEDAQRSCQHTEAPHSRGAPQGSTCGPQQEQQPSPAPAQELLPRGQDYQEVDDEEEGMWNSRKDDMIQLHEHDDMLIPSNGVSDHNSREEVSHDRPITSGIRGQMKTFEELLEEQLKVEEQRLKSVRQQQSQDGAEVVRAPPKRAFLKRGEGLSRFTNNRKALSPKMVVTDSRPPFQARVISRSNSDPAAIQRGGVQRKTTTLNKENRLRGVSSPPQDIRVESKAARLKVLGSHQRQNTEGPESIQTDPEERKTRQPHLRHVKEQNTKKVGQSAQTVRKPSSIPQPNPVTRQLGVLRRSEKTDHDAAREKSCGSRVETAGGRGGDGVPQDSFELFQEKLRHWECERQLENMELGEFELLEEAAEVLSFSSNSSFVMKVLQMDQQHRGLHPRRLSSTPIKSPPRGGGSAGLTGKSSSMNSEVLKMRDEELQNQGNVPDEDQDRCQISDVSSCGGSESEDQDVAVKPLLLPSTLCFPAPSNPPYDKRSYQDEDSCRDSDVTRVDDRVFSNADESTLIEDKDGPQAGVVFDDEDTWNDLEETAVSRGSPVSGMSTPPRTLVRKVTTSKGVELDNGVSLSPPASQLMMRLFPSLKPKAQNAPLRPPPPESNKSEETDRQLQSRQLRERLAELEIEIQRFKKENAALAKLKQDNEKIQERLRKEQLEFEQMKVEELAKFEEYKKEENRKLQKERKLFEKHASAARAIPDKKEREEIQMLKQQLGSLQEELRGRESRWASSHSRLRQQVDSLSQENSSLRDQIRMLETLRLSALKKNPVSTEKDKETKEGSRISENTSVTKGVKFANPLDSRRRSSSPPQSSSARRSSRDLTGGMKSSLKRPAGPGSSSSSSLPGRRTEDRSTCPSRIQDRQDSCSPQTEAEERSDAEEPESAQEVIRHPDGRVEMVLAGGERLTVYTNGTKKEVSADGLTVKVTFFNGDTKEVTADQRVIYFYCDAQTTHISYPDGLEVLHFPNNQTEKHFPDGRKEITFPDQTVKNLFPSGWEESVLTDGTIIRVNPDGTKEILFNTGQKEVHTSNYKRREYPDGTVKTVYSDGRQETRYPTGRLRVKDKDGNMVMDSGA